MTQRRKNVSYLKYIVKHFNHLSGIISYSIYILKIGKRIQVKRLVFYVEMWIKTNVVILKWGISTVDNLWIKITNKKAKKTCIKVLTYVLQWCSIIQVSSGQQQTGQGIKP